MPAPLSRLLPRYTCYMYLGTGSRSRAGPANTIQFLNPKHIPRAHTRISYIDNHDPYFLYPCFCAVHLGRIREHILGLQNDAGVLWMGTYARTRYFWHVHPHRTLELTLQPGIPISTLGDWYAQQTGDRSLCVGAADGSEYCTCVFQCGNGVWQRDEKSGWVFDKGCKKYCHIGVCDGQD
jgi:hypothetical protein